MVGGLGGHFCVVGVGGSGLGHLGQRIKNWDFSLFLF